jgi:hypothetical protein
MYSLIVTAKMTGVDPQAWLTDILARIAAHQLIGWTNYCPGIGRHRVQRSPPGRHDMHVNKVHHVTTITQVDLGEDEDWLRGISPLKWRSRTA